MHHKRELFVLGIVSMTSLLFLFAIGQSVITGSLVDESYEVYEMGTDVLKNAPQNYPRLPYIPLAAPGYDPAELPPRDYLVPQALSFAVDRIAIQESNYNAFLPLKEDRIHTYSGRAGYYAEDPLPFIQGYLCAYAYKIQGAPLRCERVDLAYQDEVVSFARGYDGDEYIGHQAAGIDFAALFLLTNPEYGILAASPVAYLRITKK
jgi:hypothetical protein